MTMRERPKAALLFFCGTFAFKSARRPAEVA
jgi:hypothetical protein